MGTFGVSVLLCTICFPVPGSKPFGGKDMKDDIMSGNYNFESDEWSAKAKTFIQHLLIVDSSS